MGIGRANDGPPCATWMLRTLKIVRRHPWRASIAVRWAYGLRLTLPIACGAARLPLLIYLIGARISAVTWSAMCSHCSAGVLAGRR